MKLKFILKAILLLTAANFLSQFVSAQNIFPSTGATGIGTTTPSASALLEIKSTTKGFLGPRMTMVQRNAIASPVTGLMIYQTDNTPGFYYYNSTTWKPLSPNLANPKLSNLSTTTAIDATLLPKTAAMYNLGSSALKWNNGYFSGILQVGAATITPASGMIQWTGSDFQGYNGNTWLSLTSGGSSQWTTNSTNIYYNSGNVGIGTTTPGAPLHITMANAGTAVRLQSPSPEVSFYDGNGTYQGYVWYDGASNMVLGTSCGNINGSIKLRMNCNDVFTISPQGSINLSGSSSAMNITTAGTFSGGFFGSAADLYLNASRQNSIEGTTAGNLILQTTTGTGITLHTAGNVGIGTAAPTTKLEVSTADASWGIIHTNGTVRGGFYVGSSGEWIATQTNHPLYFATSLGNTNEYAQITLLTSGNVGIGTLNPTYKLSVNGTIQAKEVRVETGWSDFVFDKNYKLRSLNEVQEYIEQNKHLPDVPSAKEVQTNGLALADMQTKMMQKIEELTLYVIELQKEVDQLKSGKK